MCETNQGARLRANITKNSRGYGYDFTVETSRNDEIITDNHRQETLSEINRFKMELDDLLAYWTREDLVASKPDRRDTTEAQNVSESPQSVSG